MNDDRREKKKNEIESREGDEEVRVIEGFNGRAGSHGLLG